MNSTTIFRAVQIISIVCFIFVNGRKHVFKNHTKGGSRIATITASIDESEATGYFSNSDWENIEAYNTFPKILRVFSEMARIESFQRHGDELDSTGETSEQVFRTVARSVKVNSPDPYSHVRSHHLLTADPYGLRAGIRITRPDPKGFRQARTGVSGVGTHAVGSDEHHRDADYISTNGRHSESEFGLKLNTDGRTRLQLQPDWRTGDVLNQYPAPGIDYTASSPNTEQQQHRRDHGLVLSPVHPPEAHRSGKKYLNSIHLPHPQTNLPSNQPLGTSNDQIPLRPLQGSHSGLKRTLSSGPGPLAGGFISHKLREGADRELTRRQPHLYTWSTPERPWLESDHRQVAAAVDKKPTVDIYDPPIDASKHDVTAGAQRTVKHLFPDLSDAFTVNYGAETGLNGAFFWHAEYPVVGR